MTDKKNKSIKSFIKNVIYFFMFSRVKKNMKYGRSLGVKYDFLRQIALRSIDDFKTIKRYNDDFLLKKYCNKQRIRFGFVVYTSSMWNVDELFKLLRNTDRFEVDIIVARFFNMEKSARKLEYDNTVSFFRTLGYSVKKASEINVKKYDALFYLSPYPFADKNVNFENVSTNTVLFHSSYSYMLSGKSGKIDLWLYHLALAYYADSDFYRQMVSNSVYYTGNAKYIGFTKMDAFYDIKAGSFKTDKKVIIYAPHHSVNYKRFKSATFEDNYEKIYEIAKKYSETTYWIYKPHPLLRSNSVKGGVFPDLKKYDEYENKWRDLDNAEVVLGGNYFNYFCFSDAMITDSVSFLAEYQFSHKPLLLLESGKEEYNEFGNKLVSVLYKCYGKDIESIEKFIQDVVFDRDEMYDERKKFFDEYLDYRKDNKSANFNLYQDILNIFEK